MRVGPAVSRLGNRRYAPLLLARRFCEGFLAADLLAEVIAEIGRSNGTNYLSWQHRSPGFGAGAGNVAVGRSEYLGVWQRLRAGRCRSGLSSEPRRRYHLFSYR